VLHNCHPGDPGSASFTLTSVGDEQNGRTQAMSTKPMEAFENYPHTSLELIKTETPSSL
jgi:hypothetical protein